LPHIPPNGIKKAPRTTSRVPGASISLEPNSQTNRMNRTKKSYHISPRIQARQRNGAALSPFLSIMFSNDEYSVNSGFLIFRQLRLLARITE
jgi:hypothetical protein